MRAQALAERLYRTKRRYLLSIARRHSDRATDAEEALQEAFILFIEHFDPDGDAPPLAWLTLTLKRECWARSKRASLPLLGSPIEPDGDVINAAERAAQTRGVMELLKRDERRALSLLALGYSYREICAITGWTYTKVNRCIAEGRARLRSLGAQESALG